jgi:GAF domain-containing protein
MAAETKGESDTEKLRRRNRELSILNSIAQALNREVDLSQALHTTLAQVAELLDLQTGWIWLLREDTCEPYLVAAQNLPPALANSVTAWKRTRRATWTARPTSASSPVRA